MSQYQLGKFTVQNMGNMSLDANGTLMLNGGQSVNLVENSAILATTNYADVVLPAGPRRRDIARCSSKRYHYCHKKLGN